MYTAATSAASGNFSFNADEYFRAWVYQMGFTMYEALIIKLVDHPLLILKLINILLGIGTALLVYFSATRVFNEFTGRIAALFYAFYIPNIIMSSVLTNQHMSIFFFMLGCTLLIYKGLDTRFRWIFIGLSFAIAQIMRPIGTVYLIAIAVYVLLFHLIPAIKLNRKQWASISAKLTGIIAVFYLVQTLVSSAFIYAGFTPYPLSNREPYWKFMVGMNQATSGSWSMEDATYVLQFPLGEERDQAELEVIKERIADKPAAIAFIIKKIPIFWGSPDGSTVWSLWEMNEPKLDMWLNAIERAMYISMSLFGVFALFALFRERINHQSLFFLILLLGYAAVHLLIEIQSRYRFDLMPVFIILQSYGVYTLHRTIQTLFTRERKSRNLTKMN